MGAYTAAHPVHMLPKDSRHPAAPAQDWEEGVRRAPVHPATQTRDGQGWKG